MRHGFFAASLALTAAVAAAAEPPELATVAAALERGKYEEALADSAALFEQHHGDPAVRALYGRALLRAGRLREAEAVLAPLGELAEAPGPGLLALARLNAFRGRHERAAELAEEALAKAPDDPAVLFWAAELVHDTSRSSALLERFLAVAPEEREDWTEAARGTLRLRAALGERHPWRVANAPERVELPLRPVWVRGGAMLGYVVEARIGPTDKPVKLMLDTGSTGLFLVERIARKRGFEFLSEETAFGGGGDRRHLNRRGLFPSFRLGELRFVDALAGTTASEIDPYGRFHGLLGIQAFSGYRAILDLPAGRLVLVRGDAADEQIAGDPFWMVSGQMLVEAQTSPPASGLFLFDTGATWSVLSARFAHELDGVRMERTRSLRGFGGTIDDAAVVHGAALSFAGRTAGEEGLRAFDMSVRNGVAEVEISGFLGLDLLQGTRITIDTTSQQVAVESPRRRDQSRDSSSSSKRSKPPNAAR